VANKSAARVSVGWPYAEDWEWLRAVTLRRLAAATFAGGWLWWVISLQASSFRGWLGPLVLMATGGLVFWATPHLSFLPAAWLFLIAQSIATSLIIWTVPDTPTVTLLGLIAGTAGLFISPALGFVAAAAISIALWLAAVYGLVPPSLASFAGALAAAIALLTWTATHPLRTTLHWSWMSYEQARSRADDLMVQRGELQRTVKDLRAAYARLERMSTELERARQAADEARRLKAEFAANISHELRTPLNLIIGFSEMMFMAPHTYGGQSLPATYRGDVEAIYRSARHLSQLVDDVLDLSQIEAGRMGLVKEPLALADVVSEAVTTVSYLLERKHLSLTTEIPSDLPLIRADRTRLRQVLINLLNNAARFTDRGGITIDARADERDVTISVTDTGVGIAAKDMPKVFEEFRQVDGSPRRREGGSGLGLAISRKFVELHGGYMGARSCQGEGSTFWFRLPLRDDLAFGQLPPAWETWARPAKTADSAGTVIVISDNERAAHLFQRYLDDYRVLVAADEREVQQLASTEPVHAAIFVARSQQEAGDRLVKGVAGLADVPLFCCSLAGGETAGDELGVASYLVKPVLRERFLAALDRVGPHVRDLLVIDDEPEVIRLLTRMIKGEARRYRVHSAYDGEEAWQFLQTSRPDVVIMDLMMPRLNGYQLLERMRADPTLRDIPVIVITAKGLDGEVISASLAGVTRGKGLSIGELMRYLRAGLEALQLPHSAPAQPAAPSG